MHDIVYIFGCVTFIIIMSSAYFQHIKLSTITHFDHYVQNAKVRQTYETYLSNTNVCKVIVTLLLNGI